MFILQEAPIDTKQYESPASAPGAIVSFEGIVRPDLKDNKRVTQLLYIANTAACIKTGEDILNEAIEIHSLYTAYCIQRIGPVAIAERAIWISASARNRDSAFKGCRYIIEEVKKRLLIWKKEFYNDGSSAWIHGNNAS